MDGITPRPKARISDAEMERRRKALRQADASNRLEGVFRDPASDAIFEAYVRGEIEATDILPRLNADSDEGGHLFQSHRGHHSNLMAATVPISWRPGWHRLEGRFWSCHRGAVPVKRQGAACVNAA